MSSNARDVERTFEKLRAGYTVSITRTPSRITVRVVASPKLDITHLLSTLERAYPGATVHIERRR